MEQKYGIVYLWYDRKHKRYYLGAHWGTEKDGYICSSRWMKQSFRRRPQDFKRRVIETNIKTKQDTFLREEYWLGFIKECEFGKRYYNLQKHWKHWNGDYQKTLSVKEKISETVKALHKDPIYKERFLEGRKKIRGRKQTQEQISKRTLLNIGKKRTPETKQKMSESQAKYSEDKKRRMMGANNCFYGDHRFAGENNPFYGKKHSEETRKKLKKTDQEKMLISQRMLGNTNSVGALWWNNGMKNKRAKSCPGTEWSRGMLS